MEMGGVEKVLLSILNNLNPEKFEMTVCLNLNQGELRNEFPAHVRKVYMTEGREDFSKNSLIHKVQLLQRSRQLKKYQRNPELIDQKILKDTYDIEIGMTYNDFEMVLNSSNKKSKKVGWFHSEINLPKLQPLVPSILKHFPQFDQMVYCSQKIMDMMHQEYPNLKYPKENVIINAIPIEEIKAKASAYDPNLIDNKTPTFVSIGRLHSRKGYHKLLEAHQKLISEGFLHKIIVLGDGEEKGNLTQLIKKASSEKTFILAGNQMNPYPFVKKANFFVLPSESEAWPLVIAEALILQKPIISTNVGDIGTMIEHSKTGHLINYNTQEMYTSMKTFLSDDNYVNSIVQNLETIENQFDNKKIFQEIEETFINLMK
jgi:glycosyltransferase involved in cell wall biosynthesis